MRFILISLCLITIASCSEEDASVVNDWGPMPRINLDRDAAALPVIDTSQDSGTTPRDASMPQEDVDAVIQMQPPVTSPEDMRVSEPPPRQMSDFSERGSYEVQQERSSAMVTNCNINYSVYTPVGIPNPPIVILGHGFARGSGAMSGWAEHLSSWGVEVVLPTLCHYNIFGGVDHEMNGQNMRELAGNNRVVYAGHSAGGLAAIIAASQDNNALGVLGLDATDTQDVPGVRNFIGRDYAGNVSVPTFGIIGEPSTCNADNNGLELYRLIERKRVVKVTSSDHCDYESPTNFGCTSNCENRETEFLDDDIRPVITALGTAAVMSLTGLSSDGDIIWSAQGLNDWVVSGIVQDIE